MCYTPLCSHESRFCMPNQRSKGKRGMSVYVPEDMKEAIRLEAERQGVSMGTLVKQIYFEALSKRGYILKEIEEDK